MKTCVKGHKQYFCDFAQGVIKEWNLKTRDGVFPVKTSDGTFTYSFSKGEQWSFHADVESPVDGEVMLCIDSGLKNIPVEFLVNGHVTSIGWDNSEIAYLSPTSPTGLKYAYKIKLHHGSNTIDIRLYASEEGGASTLSVNILPPPGVPASQFQVSDQVLAYEPEEYPAGSRSFSFDGYRAGAGTGREYCGRFGFTKGDGILDCAMPCLGVIDRMYLSGHPDYHKPHRWMFSVLPHGIEPQTRWHGSLPPGTGLAEGDNVEVSYLGVKWGTSFTAAEDYFERKAGKEINFSCSYSVASPGILIETDDPGLALRQLEYAGNYQSCLLPISGGITNRALNGREDIYDLKKDGRLTAGWMMLFGATEFPDIPLMLTFAKSPSKIRTMRLSNKILSGIDVHVTGGLAYAQIAAPFGIQAFKPGETGQADFLADALRRCRFWNRALRAFPAGCEEYYRIVHQDEKINILQRFSYRFLRDEWGTEPLQLAPVPPVVGMLDDLECVDSTNATDFHFPTKYGFLKGLVGNCVSSYSVPFMPLYRKFPLRQARDGGIADELTAGFPEYLAFHGQFKSSDQAYPYSGANVCKYGYPLTMFNFMKPEFREVLEAKALQSLESAVNPDVKYDYSGCDWGGLLKRSPDRDEVFRIYENLYDSPEHKKKSFFNWYQRREPLGGATYSITYFNVLMANQDSFRGEREEVRAYRAPLVEIDWGTGLTFYGIYLSALLTGNWEPVRRHWGTIKDGFKYFDVMQDWACMGAGFCENGVGWVEGANYGAFTAYTLMAEAVGDEEARDHALYLGAKQATLRMGIFTAADRCLHKYFDCGPWWSVPLFQEEMSPAHTFTCLPKMRGENLYRAFNIMTTEGVYPEIFMMLMRYLPEDFNSMMQLFRRVCAANFGEHGELDDFDWRRVNDTSCYLLCNALNANVDKNWLEREILAAEKSKSLFKEWRGVHTPERLLPENWFKAYLHALMASSNYPVWLEFWYGLRINLADYSTEKCKATLDVSLLSDNASISFGVKSFPVRIALAGIEQPFETEVLKYGSRLHVKLRHSGLMEMFFT